MPPSDYAIRLMRPADFGPIGEICRIVYPDETPYTPAELAEHLAVFPQGQFVAEHVPSGQPVGVHFTLRLSARADGVQSVIRRQAVDAAPLWPDQGR